MKRLWIMLTMCLLFLAACGGNTGPPAGENEAAPPEETVAEPAAPTAAEPSVDDSGDDAEADAADVGANDGEPATEEAGADAGAYPAGGEENDDPEADASPIDSNPAGLPVNPEPVVPGEPFIVEGVIVNASMIPVDSPQFLIEGDNGVRYRLDSQPADEIFTNQGGQLLPHQYGPGVRVRATALLPADATAADVAVTEDLIVILEE